MLNSSHALLVDWVRQGKEIDSEEGFGGYELGELRGWLTSSNPWKSDEPSDALTLGGSSQQLPLGRE